jgi:large-conductance mechanosensitive channel
MAFKDEIIIRTVVGTVLGLALNSFLASIGSDVLKPIFSRKSFDKLEKEFVVTIYGVKINYGDLIGHFLTLTATVVTVYMTLYVLEIYKIM